MTLPWSTIDCDVHVNVPSMQALLPHLDEYWRDSVVDRGLNSLESISYPPIAPRTARADWRGPKVLKGRTVTAGTPNEQ